LKNFFWEFLMTDRPYLQLPYLQLLCVLFFLLLAAGCSDEAAREVMMRKDCLENVGVAYRDFHAANDRSPTSINELASFMDENAGDNSAVTTEAIKRLREGQIVMFWNAALKEITADSEQYVLGYEAPVSRTGGYLVTGGGSIMLVTPNSFKDFKEYPLQKAGESE
jgi:hypothetical protein